VTALASALYAGEVVHQRFTPRAHRLRYRMFQMLMDLDEGPALHRRLRLFSFNRFNVFSFHERDHGDGRSGPLRGWVVETLERAGIAIGAGRVDLLCMPRILGHVFNPISIYYCHAADGRLAAMLYEVNSTFGERHSYLIPAPADEPAPTDVVQSCDKVLHVSPFMDMDMTYDFRVSWPRHTVSTAIQGNGPDGRAIIYTRFFGKRRPLTDEALLQTFFQFPLLTLKVVLAIHWEAVKLLLKGLRLRPKPPAPDRAVSATHLSLAADSHGTVKQSA